MTTVTINGGGSQAVGFVAGTDAQNNQQIVSGDHNYVVGTNLHRFVYTVRARALHRKGCTAIAVGNQARVPLFETPLSRQPVTCGCVVLPRECLAWRAGSFGKGDCKVMPWWQETMILNQ